MMSRRSLIYSHKSRANTPPGGMTLVGADGSSAEGTRRTYQFVSPLYLLFDILDRKPSDVVIVGGGRDQGGGEKLQRTAGQLCYDL